MKKSLYPIIVVILILIIVVIFFYLTRDEVNESNSNNNINTDTGQVVHTCQGDGECTGTCTCGCQHVLGTCPTDLDVDCITVPECQCQNGACQEKLDALNSNLNQNNNTNTNQTEIDNEEVTVAGSDFTETGNLTGEAITGFTLLYEEPGAPALTAVLFFDYPGYASSCTVDGIPMTCQEAMDQDLLVTGDLVTITGTEVIAGEIAVIMLDK